MDRIILIIHIRFENNVLCYSLAITYDLLGLFYSDGDGCCVQSFWEGDGDAAIVVDAVLQSLAGAEQSDTLRG